MLAIKEKFTAESSHFSKLLQSISRAVARAVLCNVGNTTGGVGLQLKNAGSAAEELIQCICTLRKLHEYKHSLRKTYFTPGQYKMIIRKVKSNAVSHQASTQFNCNEVDKSDSSLYMLNKFARAVRENASTSKQLKYGQRLVDDFEKFTIKEVLSAKKPALVVTRTSPKKPFPTERRATKPAAGTRATISSSVTTSSSLTSLSTAALSCSSSSSQLANSLKSLGPPPLAITTDTETRLDDSWSELCFERKGHGDGKTSF
jgi:hypothetical protein